MTLRYTPAAVADLRNLRVYLADEFGATIAQKTITKLIEDIFSLKTFPGLMRPLSDKILRETSYKYFLCGKLSVAILLKENTTISVLRILDQRSDTITQIFVESSSHRE